ncbi:MAG: Lon protease-like protein [Gammaproteobacteria bacterium]|jgi:Lon protease-like protein
MHFADLEKMETIPLFPLNLVLFPGGELPLRIFEPRYIDLVGECLRTDTGFGVCYIKKGKEVGGGAQCHDIGSYAKIVDWSQLEDGLLGITAKAEKRFLVKNYSERANKLLQGEIHWLDEGAYNEIGENYLVLQTLLTRVLEHFEIKYDDQAQKLEDPAWLGYRLAEFLPLEPAARQTLLEMEDSLERLSHLRQMLNEPNIADILD